MNDRIATEHLAGQASPDSIEAQAHPALDAVDCGGKILSSVAILKGVTTGAISEAVNVPKNTIDAYFAGRKVGFREDIRKNIAGYLGVDLMTCRLSSDRVHIFALNKLPFGISKEMFDKHMRHVSFLLRDGKAAKLEMPLLGRMERNGARMRGAHVMQNSHSRAIFLGGWCIGFRAVLDLESFKGCKWASGKMDTSVVKVAERTLSLRIADGDVTPMEFDEIFRSPDAASWADIEMSARVNQVSRQEILEWIETVGQRRALESAVAASQAQLRASPSMSSTKAHTAEIITPSFEHITLIQSVPRVANGE